MSDNAVPWCRNPIRHQAGCRCPAHRPSSAQARDSHWLPVPPTVSPLLRLADPAALFSLLLCYHASYEAGRQQKPSSESNIQHLSQPASQLLSQALQLVLLWPTWHPHADAQVCDGACAGTTFREIAVLGWWGQHCRLPLAHSPVSGRLR